MGAETTSLEIWLNIWLGAISGLDVEMTNRKPASVTAHAEKAPARIDELIHLVSPRVLSLRLESSHCIH